MAQQTEISRRNLIKTGLLSTFGLAAGGFSAQGMGAAKTPAGGITLKADPLVGGLQYPYTLPELSFANDAFAPAIDAKTMEIHHDRHHAGYVRKLNAALEKAPVWQDVPLVQLLGRLDELPASIRESVRNNGGGHLNHSIYWATMAPGGTPPDGLLEAAIKRDFGGMGPLREALAASGSGRFGSGWAWLQTDDSGKLSVSSTPNQDNPAMSGAHPLFGIDVWEHAYYLNYQNRRGDYIRAYLDVADWTSVAKRYGAMLAA